MSAFRFAWVLVVAVGWLSSASAAERRFSPFGNTQHPVTRDVPRQHRGSPAGSESLFRVSFELYRHVISPIDGPRCSHQPTCSLYGLQAVRRYKIVGLWLTLDRLLRSGDSSAVRPLPRLDDGETTRLFDPLEASTFWFSSSQR